MTNFVFTVDNCKLSDERFTLLELLRFSEPTIAGWQYAGRVHNSTNDHASAVFFRSDGSGDQSGFQLIPIPQYRLWSKPEDVPQGVVWLGFGNCSLLVLRVTDKGVSTLKRFWSWADLRTFDIQWSHDRQTWKPCKVKE